MMKRALSVFGLIGLVGCFLPLMPGVSLFDLRSLDPSGVYLLMAAFAVPIGIGFADRLPLAAALGAIGCFGYVLVYRFGFDTFDLLVHGSLGARMIAVAAIGGLVAAIGAIAETQRR